MLLIFGGAFTKSAQVPFHFWLPAAMEAPTPASAFLHSATMVKLGVYLLARFDQVFAGVPAFGTALVAVGSATMVVAAIRAFGSDGHKAVLAQSTVGSLGLLVVLIGLDGEAAAAATVAFILAHALYKAALFFCAGTVIHATHEPRLGRLAGLGRALPATAAAASLAAISMAGLPPTFGFISKEIVLEAQLHAAGGPAFWAGLLGNALFVAIAGVAGITPYFSRAKAPPVVRHRETPGLFVGPLALGGLGVLFGFWPGLVEPVVAAAADALVAGPGPGALSLWHGFTPALALSAAVVGAGALLFYAWDAVHPRLAGSRTLAVALGDAWYNRAFDGTVALAGFTTRALQNGDQHRYSRVVLGFVAAVSAGAVVVSGSPVGVPAVGAVHPTSAIVLVLMASGALAAARTASLLKSVVAIGVIGFGSALIYVMNGAPDLALTQFAVEVLVVVILTALLLRIPPAAPSRGVRERRSDALLSAAVGAVLFVALSTMAVRPLDRTLTDYFSRTSYTEAHGRNVVNVIIVDYRGLDTLGEISVIAFATTAVWALLRRRGRRT
jgi:multicomponent Na+:H+ antiporter subunit A